MTRGYLDGAAEGPLCQRLAKIDQASAGRVLVNVATRTVGDLDPLVLR